ncbi:MAG: hypothetical protein D6717_06835 [Gammaproteobacteria bacterium]|nr:MAG: hypothetical protein D6717_06835 [Gammaproteobacteria bacterium]
MFQKSDVLEALRAHIGSMNGVHARDLVKEITGGYSCPPLERRLRQLITELRLDGHHVCAHPETGYFMAANEDELNQTCLFLYERAMTGLAQVSRMKKISLPDLRGQLRLPT